MKIKDSCPLCEKEFVYDDKDEHLKVDLNNHDGMYLDFPNQDDTWASRRWNKDYSISNDLSGAITICPSCYKERTTSTDVNVGCHLLCAKRGCPHDANESGKYCNECYDEVYPCPVNDAGMTLTIR